MAEAKAHTGGCHCGNVRYEVTSDLAQVTSCNCSICSKLGALWIFVSPQEFSLTTGQDKLGDAKQGSLGDYQFHKKVIHHRFCPICGIESFAQGQMPDGTPMFAVNVRCLDDVDVWTLSVTPIDGKSF